MYKIFYHQEKIIPAFSILIVLLPDYSKICALITITIALILYIIKIFLPNRIKINNKKTNIILEYGDLLKKTDGIVVIPVDRNYNTTVDDIIISSKSIHGKFINTMVNDKNKILECISSSLNCESIGEAFRTQKPGTVVPITIRGCTYYLLALSKLDKNNKAQCTPEEYARAIERLMDYTNTHFNGNRIYLPLIGGGLSNVFNTLDDTESLQILVSLIKLSQHSRIDEIHIVVNKWSTHKALIHMIN